MGLTSPDNQNYSVYFLRQTCAAQIKTLSMGRTLHPMDPQNVARFRDQMAASPFYGYDGATEWGALLRKLERMGSDHAR